MGKPPARVVSGKDIGTPREPTNEDRAAARFRKIAEKSLPPVSDRAGSNPQAGDRKPKPKRQPQGFGRRGPGGS